MNEITILSGKGGTGKTSLSAAFASLGNHVVADCDVDAANLHLVLQPENWFEEKFITGHKAIISQDKCTNCGICIDYCRFGAISFLEEKINISETLCDGCKLCSRICPEEAITMEPSEKSRWHAGTYTNGFMVHARLAPGEENSGKLVNVVRDYAKKIASAKKIETTIIDGAPGTGCPVISSVTGAQKAILVTEPTRSGFHDLKRVIQLTASFKVKSYVVINKYDLNESMTNEITAWCEQQQIQVLGRIPFDKQIIEAMLHCKSIVEWAPDSEAGKAIIDIWKQLQTEK